MLQEKQKGSCNLQQRRADVSFHRTRSWYWQDKIYTARTKTNYNERKTHGCSYLKFLSMKWKHTGHKARVQFSKLHDVRKAICYIFKGYCNQALSVANCESGLNIWAQNGQYLGLFQMGSSEREKYGYGNTALIQSYAAHRYFIDSGRDWSPWSCKP